MFLLGLFLASFLIAASIALGGWDKFVVFWDTPSVAWVLLGVPVHILAWGRPYFLRGLSAIVKKPPTGDAAVADYFRRLTVWTLGVGVSGMVAGVVWGFVWLKQPDRIGAPMAVSLFTFLYAGCLALMLFAPISARFATENDKTERRRFPVLSTLFAVAAFVLLCAVMALLQYSLTTARAAEQVAEPPTVDAVAPYLNPWLYWDVPSLVLVVGCLVAFRLSAGRLRNRFDWVPVCLVYGLLGTIIGMVLMLCDLDPDKYAAGCMVALLTTFYGILAAIIVVFLSKEAGGVSLRTDV